MAGEDEEVTVDVTLTDYLSASAEKAAAATDELAKQVKQLNRGLLLLDRRATKAALALDKLTLATAAATTATDKYNTNLDTVNKNFTKYEKGIKDTEKAQKKLTKETEKGEKGLRKYMKILGGVGRTARIAGMGLFYLAAGFLAVGAGAAIGVAIQNIIQIVAALGQLVAFAALAPTAIGGLIATVLTLKVAFHGMGAAMHAAFKQNPAAFKKSLKELSPAAQAVAKDIYKIVPSFKKSAKSIQDQFFKPIRAGFLGMIAGISIPVTIGMQKLSGTFGGIAKDVLSFFSSVKGKNFLADIFHGADSAAAGFKRTVTPVLNGLASVAKTVKPLWDKLTDKFGDAGVKFGNWLDKISKNGQLIHWLDMAMQVASQLWTSLKLVFDILGDVVRAAGGPSLTPLVTFLSIVHKFTSSKEGQAALANFFKSLRDILNAVAPALVIVAKAIGNTLAPAISTIIQNLAPGFTIFLQAVADALAQIAPYWGPLAKAVGDLLVAFAPLMPVLAQIGRVLLMELVNVLKILITLITPFLDVAGPLLESWFQTFADVLQIMSPLLIQFMSDFSQAFNGLAPVMKTWKIFADTIIKLLPIWFNLMKRLLPVLAELAVQFGQAFVQALVTITPYLPQLAEAFVQLVTAIANPTFINAFVMFVVTFAKLAPLFLANLPLLIQFTILALKLATVFIQLITIVVNVGTKIVQTFENVVRTVRDKVNEVTDFLTKPFKEAKEIIAGIFDDIISNIKTSIETIKNVSSGVGNFFSHLNPFRAAGGPVEAGQKYTVGEIGREMYVPNNGAPPQLIGTNGMEERSFPTSGMILPSYMLDAFDRMNAGIERRMARSGAGTKDGMSAAEIRELVNASGNVTNNYDVTLVIPQGTPLNTEADIEKAVYKALARLEQDKKERR